MTPADMKNACHEMLAGCRQLGFPEKQANLTLVTPKGWKAPPKFPRGYLLQVKENGDRVWHFPALRVLAWVDANFGAAA